MKKLWLSCMLVVPMLAFAQVDEEQQNNDPGISTTRDLTMDALSSIPEKKKDKDDKQNPAEYAEYQIVAERANDGSYSTVGYMKGKKHQLGQLTPAEIANHPILGIYIAQNNDACKLSFEMTGGKSEEILDEIKNIKLEGLTDVIDLSKAKKFDKKKLSGKYVDIDCNYFSSWDNLPNMVNKITINN